MIVHCSRKLAARLPGASTTALEETSPLGSWHADLYHIDRRQCVLFCHDASRFALFMPGLRKEHFAELGSKWFRLLFAATLTAFGCDSIQVKKAGLALGPIRFDSATDRSVQGSMRVIRQELDGRLMRVQSVMDLDPVVVSRELSHRPATVYGKSIWPDRLMLEQVRRI